MDPNLKKISTNFSRGLNLSVPTLIDPNECQATDNLLFDNGCYTRKGTVLYGTIPAPVQTLNKHYNQDGTSYFAAFGGGMLFVDNTSGNFNQISSEPITGNFISVTAYDDFMYFTDYDTDTKYYDGSGIGIAGLSSPTFTRTIASFENATDWVAVSGSQGSVTLDPDSTYTHVDVGKASLKLTTDGTLRIMLSGTPYYDLTTMGDGVFSSTNDIIQIFTLHAEKNNIGSLTLDFLTGLQTNAGGTIPITSLSSWVGCSSDGWALTHSIPKSVFTTIHYPFGWQWNNVTPRITLIANTLYDYSAPLQGYYTPTNASTPAYLLSGNYVSGFIASGNPISPVSVSGYNNSGIFTYVPASGVYQSGVLSGGHFFGYLLSSPIATVTIDNLRMTKTPPIPSPMFSVNRDQLFFGSSVSNVNRFFANQDAYTADLQLQGAPIQGAQIPDGISYYKMTLLKKGPGGIEIESNPTYQSSGCIISTSISSYTINISGVVVPFVNISPAMVFYVEPGVAFGGLTGPSYFYTYRIPPDPKYNVPYARIDSQAVLANLQAITFLPANKPTDWGSALAGSVTASGFTLTPYVNFSGYNLSSIMTTSYPKLDDIPVAPEGWGVQARRIYRRMGYDNLFRTVNTICNNSSITFTDTVPQGVLGDVLDETHWPPPKAKYIYNAANQRTYYLNINETGNNYTSRCRFSNPYAPHYVPLENAFDVSPGDGTQATGIFEYMNIMHILKERSVWAWDGSNLQCLHTNLGCVAPDTIGESSEDVFWLSDEGVVRYNLRFQNISKMRNRVDTIIQRLPKQYISQAAGVFYNGFYLLALTDIGSTVNNIVLCYDVVNDIWTTFPNTQVNCWSVWQGFQDGYRLFYGNNAGQICEFFVGDTDLGTPIYTHVRTKEFGLPSPTFSPRDVYLYTTDMDGHSRQIIVAPYYDWVNNPADNNTMMTNGSQYLCKADLPARDDAGFFSVDFQTSGRVRFIQCDIYSRTEGLR